MTDDPRDYHRRPPRYGPPRKIYTDGARGHDGVGGWAWVEAYVVNGILEVLRSDSGSEIDTTNNRMEMLAVANALTTYPPTDELEIISDSAYVVNCFNDKWYEGWRERGWVNSKNKPVENRDIWERLLDLVLDRPAPVRFTHVRGHNGDLGNTEADRLAVAARQFATPVAPPRIPAPREPENTRVPRSDDGLRAILRNARDYARFYVVTADDHAGGPNHCADERVRDLLEEVLHE